MDSVLRRLLALQPAAGATLEAWWHATRPEVDTETLPVDRALLGGVLADRLGFAFASGYQAALQALFGPLASGLASLCVTEAAGNKPRDIATTLRGTGGDTLELTGEKRWATGGSLAATLFVVATTGPDAEGRPRLRVARIATSAPGVRITASSAPFVPEVPHASVTLDRVAVTAADLLPGDGYTEYVKPFRTVEDVHVHAALIGYLLGVARRIHAPRELTEQLLATALAVRAIAAADPRSPATHVALAGVLTQSVHVLGLVERVWEDEAPGPEWDRWQRDRPLLRVAGAARTARRDTAWQQLTPA